MAKIDGHSAGREDDGMEENHKNPPKPWFTALILAVVLLLLVGFWLFATSAMFGAKAVVDRYLAPHDAGSTTGFPPPAGGY